MAGHPSSTRGVEVVDVEARAAYDVGHFLKTGHAVWVFVVVEVTLVLRTAVGLEGRPEPVPQKAVVVCEIDQGVVVLLIGGESIAHSQPLQVHAGVLHDQHGQSGDVDAGVALSGQEKLIVLVLREKAEEIFKGFIIALGDFRVIGRIRLVIGVRKAHPSWGLEVQHIGNQVPRIGVVLQGGTIGLDQEGAVLSKEPVQELQPGPPLSQSTTGLLLGSFWDSTNQ